MRFPNRAFKEQKASRWHSSRERHDRHHSMLTGSADILTQLGKDLADGGIECIDRRD